MGCFKIRSDTPYLSRREVKIDVWKYIRIIDIDLDAGFNRAFLCCNKNFAHHDRALSHEDSMCSGFCGAV